MRSWRFLENVFFLGLLLNGYDEIIMKEKVRGLINISVNSLKIYHVFFHHKKKLKVFSSSLATPGDIEHLQKKNC